MTDEELFRLQMELECIGLDKRGRLCRIPGPSPDDISSFSLVRLRDGYLSFVRSDIPNHTCHELLGLNPEKIFKDPILPCAVLNCGAPFQGITGVIPDSRTSSSNREVEYNSELSAFVIRKGDLIASKAFSARQNDKAAELAVETVEELRGMGLAAQVSIAWRDHQLTKKRIPIYSYKVSNKASKALAKKLEVVEFFEFIGYP